MLTIPIQVSGDIWGNRDSVKQILDQTTPGQSVTLDLCSEGPSLQHMGVIDLVNPYNLDVSITRWSNGIEQAPFNRVLCNTNSHFFPMSYHYWVDEIPNTVTAQFRFGLFQGRGCPSRNRILHDAVDLWPEKFLLSKMSTLYGDAWGTKLTTGASRTESLEDWFDDIDYAIDWLNKCSIPSIDSRVVQDQYRIPEVSAGEMAKSLFQYYSDFNVELVCETYTNGETFFPTEKTVRPIVGNRPFLIYGPKNYLNNLQQKGFQTFSELWDESYDQLEGTARWAAMSKLITDLISVPAHIWQETISHASKITQHNRTIVRQMIRDLKGI